MKKLFALALVVLGLAACQTDHSDLDVQFDSNATITLSIPADAVTRAGDSDSAASGLDNTDGEKLRFILEIYDENGDKKIRETQYANENTLTANFPVRLVPGRSYTFVAWADMVTAEGVDNHYITSNGLTEITLNGDWNAMDETRDAFTASKTIPAYSSTEDLNMQLTRPFAKLRVIATDVADITRLGLTATHAKVAYTVPVATSYNAFEQKVAGTGSVNHEYEIAAYTANNNETTQVLYTDYIFANEEQGAVKFTLTTYEDAGYTKQIREVNFNTDIPVKRNMLTTLTGNVMTEGNNVSVEVNPVFPVEGGKHDITAISSYQDLLDAIGQGGEYLVINDIVVNVGASTQSLAATRTGEAAAEESTEGSTPATTGKTTTINLNGFTITVNNNSATAAAAITIPAGDTLVIAGNGSIKLTEGSTGAVFNNNDGEVIIAGGEFEDNATDTNANIFTKEENVTDYVKALKDAFTNGGKYTLTADVTLSETITLAADKTLVLDLNGKTISQVKECTASYEMILNKGNLTITGNGKLSFKDTSAGDPTYGWGSYTLRNEGTLVVENGTIEHLGEQDAHMICAIFQYSGHSTINGGKISTPNYRSARLWSGDMTINGGEFEGQLWLQAVNDTSDLTINGGTFAPRGGDSSSVFVTNTGKTVKFAVKGGNFTTKIGMSVPFACITGGEFTTAAKEATAVELIPDNYSFTELENGNWTVEKTYEWNDDNTVLKIYGAAGLKYFAYEVNKYSNYERPFDGKTVLLENDINLNGVEWTPIGDYRFSANRFCGTFDGQEHIISNFKITKKTDKNDSNKSSYGFFGNVEGTIKNLTIANAEVNSYAYTGALAGRLNNGLIENCHAVNCAVSNTYWQGGILIGQINAEGENVSSIVKDCSVSNSSITSKSAIGAISGPVTTTKGGSISFENCEVNNCQINQEGSFGGSYDNYFGSMFGYLEADENSSITIVNCTSVDTTVKGEADAPISGDFDGNISIDGYNFIADGLFYKDKTYVVKNANGLVALSGMTITGGENVELGADIDLKDVEFNGLNAFNPENNNTFDGKGHTVSNWTYTGRADDMGFIKNWVGTIKNLTIKNAILRTGGRSAVIAAKPYGNIENCHVVDCNFQANYWACGLIAGMHNSGNMKNCTATNSSINSTGGTAAITGVLNETAGTRVYDGCEVSNCTIDNGGDDPYAGAAIIGLINIDNASIKLVNCTQSNNTYKGTAKDEFVGYNAGDNTTVTIE